MYNAYTAAGAAKSSRQLKRERAARETQSPPRANTWKTQWEREVEQRDVRARCMRDFCRYIVIYSVCAVMCMHALADAASGRKREIERRVSLCVCVCVCVWRNYIFSFFGMMWGENFGDDDGDGRDSFFSRSQCFFLFCYEIFNWFILSYAYITDVSWIFFYVTPTLICIYILFIMKVAR